MNLRESRSGWKYKAYLMYRFAFFGMRAVSDTEVGNIPRWFMHAVHLPLLLGQAIPVIMRRSERQRLWDQETTATLAMHNLRESQNALRPLQNTVHNLQEELRITRETLQRYGGLRGVQEAEENIKKTVCYIIE